MSSEYAFSQSVREALLRDEQLVSLLGGTHVFEGYETQTSTSHINICESHSLTDWSHEEGAQDSVITLQLWSHSGEKTRAQKLIEAVEQALENAGLLKPGAKILLQKEFVGSRKLPDNGEFQGLLRYHAERQPDAA